MKYQTDKVEICSLIHCFVDKNEDDTDKKEIIFNITRKIGDKFLDGRAEYLLEQYNIDINFRKKVNMLSSICNTKNKNCSLCPIKKYCTTYIKQEIEKNKNTKLKFIDLFCGSGGLSLGFSQVGFVPYLANDIQECCIDTYSHNHPEVPRENIILGNIESVVDKINQMTNETEIDVVVGGPPCQGFSMANRQRLIDDPRNKLYKYYIKIIGKVKPKFFVMENVKGMLSVASQVKEDFENIGYHVTYKVLNAKDFGVPQNRERLIYIGNRVGVENEKIFTDIMKKSQKMEKFVLADALYGLPTLQASRIKNATELENEQSGYKISNNPNPKINRYVDIINNGKKVQFTFNHKARYNNDRDIEIYTRLNEGDRSDDHKIVDIMPYKSRNDIFKDKYFKLESKKVCKTITAHMKYDCNMYIHPFQARGLTPREAARIQSYPDDYFFRGSYTKTYMQIGNSVPPLLAKAIASVIKKYIEGVD